MSAMPSHRKSGPREQANVAETLEKWVHGWVISRCVEPASDLPNGGFRINVGIPGHIVRYVLLGTNLLEVESIAKSVSTPGTWLKVCASEKSVTPILPSRWVVTTPEFLMSCRVTQKFGLDVPSPYTLMISNAGASTEARIQLSDGTLAARAKMTEIEGRAMFDQVVTEPDHRRKGLGSLAMKALWNRAIEKEIRDGVLVATEEGLRLYEALGWRVVSPLTAAYSR